MRGVESKQSSRWACASHRATATNAASLGKTLKRRWKASTSSRRAAPSVGGVVGVGSVMRRPSQRRRGWCGGTAGRVRGW